MAQRVLIVDDNRASLYMLETLLRGYGLEVTSAENGKDALEKARLNPPDMIISDILMPVMDGYTLCREWKSDDALKHIPLVFYTATYTEPRDEKFALSLGADRFVLKPQDNDVFMDILQGVLEENYEVKQVAASSLGEEMEFFRQYNEILSSKLEKKMSDLETANRELRLLEERFRMSFENVSDIIYTIDSNLTITSVSPGVERLLGYRPEDFIGRPVSDLAAVLTPESLERAVADISVVLSGETIFSTIYEFIAKDGEKKYGEVSGSPTMHDGRIKGLISVARDITDRKRAEEALTKSEEKFRKAFYTTPDSVNINRLEDGMYVSINPGFTRIMGYTEAEIIGKTSLEYDIWENIEDRQKLVAGLKKDGTVNELEAAFRTKDGDIRYGLMSASVIDLDGVPHILNITRDITDRKRAREALRESESKYRLLADNVNDVIFVLDMNLNYTYVSPSVKILRGYEPEEVLKQSSMETLTPSSSELVTKTLSDVIELEKSEHREISLSRTLELEMKRKDGTTVWTEVKVSFIRDENEQPVGILGVTRDITERKRAEEKLQRSEAFLNKIFEESPSPMWISDENGTLIRINQACCDLLNITTEEVVGTYNILNDNIVKEQGFSPLVKSVFDEGRTVRFEMEYQTSQLNQPELQRKASVALDVTIFPIRESSGKITNAVIQHIDITERKKAEDALRESEKNYRELIDGMSETVWVIDFNGDLIDVNNTAVEVLGYSKEELLGIGVYGVDSSLKEENIKALAKAMPSDKLQIFETLHRTKDGKKFPVEVCSSIVTYQGKQSILSIARNITDRKRAEEALRESETKYRGILENMDDAYYELNLKGDLVFFNEALISKTGYSREELMGMNYRQYISPETCKQVSRVFSEIYKTGQSNMLFDYEIIMKDGKRKNYESWANALFDENNRVIGFRGMAHDITARKQAENRIKEYSENLERKVEERTKDLNEALHAMEEARDKIDGIIKSVADGIIVTDLSNRVVLMNRAAEDLLDVRFSDVINKSIDYAVKEDILRERIKSLKKKEPGYEFDFEVPGAEDHSRVMRARTSIIQDKEGVQTGIITVIHDVTYEREMDRMKTEFLSTAAHELRTPLTSIRGFSELLLSRNDVNDDERARFVGYINRQSENLARIIDDLLDISRIESRRVYVMNKVPTDITELIGSTIPYFKVQTDRHRFDTDFPEHPVEVMIDRKKIEQVIGNIVGNAVKYSPRGGVIRIRGEVVEGEYRISVEDEGIGMTSDQVKKIFDKFYRADVSGTDARGTGLGMTIVKYIIEAHEGQVWVESEPGKGTTVTFSIPL